ncbi:Putative major facilitator transporter Str1/Tri12, MFS transporter superfamily [Septoria linicola]|uniref:Major facilitator transporter Str1/Tri12, MFS transporter superfamily n=1 Tax=Septoria linicola TaxID=215465 RepID=A0A9Q9AM94_9PEZI|nr:Putative major facilitator transporter Str1/Tri12, MFS transporter superfamily [Septoria linicola]
MSQQLQSKLQELELAHAGERKREHIRQSEALATDASQVRQGYFTSWPLIGAIASISLSTVASYWGFSPAAAVITVINRDIGPSANASLFSIIWSVASAISIILFGRISDKFGRRWILIAATATGFVGGVVACTANTINTLVGANVMLGLAAGVHRRDLSPQMEVLRRGCHGSLPECCSDRLWSIFGRYAGFVGLAACVCIKDYDPYFNNHVSRQIYKGGKDSAGAVQPWKKDADESVSEKQDIQLKE